MRVHIMQREPQHIAVSAAGKFFWLDSLQHVLILVVSHEVTDTDAKCKEHYKKLLQLGKVTAVEFNMVVQSTENAHHFVPICHSLCSSLLWCGNRLTKCQTACFVLKMIYKNLVRFPLWHSRFWNLCEWPLNDTMSHVKVQSQWNLENSIFNALAIGTNEIGFCVPLAAELKPLNDS